MSLYAPEVTEDGGYPAPYERPSADMPMAFAPLGEWLRQSACKGADPLSFDALDDAEWQATAPAEIARRQRDAVAHCIGCPVREACLADAVENGNTGIRGGVLIHGGHHGRPPRHDDLIGPYFVGALNVKPIGRGRPRKAA